MFINDKHLFLMVLEAGMSKTMRNKCLSLINIYFSWFWRLECPKLCFVVCEGLLPGSQMVVFSLCYMVEGALDLWSLLHVCSALSDALWPMDYSPPGSFVPGIFQTRKLGRVAISFSRGSFQPRDKTRVSCVSCIGRHVFFTTLPPIRALILFMKAPSSWPNHPPTPKPHILIPVL